MSLTQYPTRLPCGNRVLDLSRTHVMGILNVTPDSFSDGGRFSQRDAALRHAEEMVAAGATLIDVGANLPVLGHAPSRLSRNWSAWRQLSRRSAVGST